MPNYFSKNYQLEAIRSDLHKVLGAMNELLPPKPIPEMLKVGVLDDPEIEGPVEAPVEAPALFRMVGDSEWSDVPDFVSVEARDNAMKKINSMYPLMTPPRFVGPGRYVSDVPKTPEPALPPEHYYSGNRKPRKPRPVEPHLVEPLVESAATRQFNSMYPLMTAVPVDYLDEASKREMKLLREALTELQNRYTDTEMARRRLLENNRVMRIELRITASERDVLARKLAEIHSTAAPNLTSKLTPIEFP